MFEPLRPFGSSGEFRLAPLSTSLPTKEGVCAWAFRCPRALFAVFSRNVCEGHCLVQLHESNMPLEMCGVSNAPRVATISWV